MTPTSVNRSGNLPHRRTAPLIDKEFSGTTATPSSGLSMGGQAALTFRRAPKLYPGVASWRLPRSVRAPTQAYVHPPWPDAGSNAINMWGPPRSQPGRPTIPVPGSDKLRGRTSPVVGVRVWPARWT